MRVAVSDIELDVVIEGPREGVPLVLVRGLGSNLAQWPPELRTGLTARGLRVVCFDNRDAGRSSVLRAAGVPDLAAVAAARRAGVEPSVPYRLSDMAADVAGLIEALELGSAHVLGLSLGGMIAQELAIHAPERVRSLISLMSSSGAPGLPAPAPHVLEALLAEPEDPSDPERVWPLWLAERRIEGSSAWPDSDTQLRAEFDAAWRRGLHADGSARQLAALVADDARWRRLAEIACPTLVVHGDADPLVAPECGRDTARRIPGSRLEWIAGMGHDLPRSLAPSLATLVADFVLAADVADRAGRLQAGV